MGGIRLGLIGTVVVETSRYLTRVVFTTVAVFGSGAKRGGRDGEGHAG